MDRNKIALLLGIATTLVCVLGGITLGLNIVKRHNEDIIDGGVTTKNGRLPGYSETIKSKEIVSFKYDCGRFKVSCYLKDNELYVKSTGGYSFNRDGSYFKLDYKSKNTSILDELQSVIENYNISENNGYEHEISGIDPSLSTTIIVNYKSNEKIYKYDNQSNVISEEAEEDIYELFHKSAKENGFDFTSDGSNVELYNDATKEYVQGTWKGTHFGSEYKVIFEGTKIKIYKDGKLTDDTYYKIIDGDIVNDKPKKGVTLPKDKNDYEEFSDISIFRKNNDFIMTMYFMKDSYSTDDLKKE